MSNNEFSNDFEIQDAEASSVGMNNFLFHNNQEFINFQRCLWMAMIRTMNRFFSKIPTLN